MPFVVVMVRVPCLIVVMMHGMVMRIVMAMPVSMSMTVMTAFCMVPMMRVMLQMINVPDMMISPACPMIKSAAPADGCVERRMAFRYETFRHSLRADKPATVRRSDSAKAKPVAENTGLNTSASGFANPF